MQIQSSILDYSYPYLDPAVWDGDRKLYAYQKDFILRLINTMYETYELKQPETWVEDIVIIGSLTTVKWLLSSDLDVHIRVNLDAFIASNMPRSTKEEAFAKLDQIRKEFDRAKILLPMSNHPAEFYFESIEFKPSNVALVGVYSLMQNKWLKAPILFEASLDLEEAKKSAVEAAEALAEELDGSLGKIQRNIKRIDELEQVIRAWGPDKQQLFYSKVEQKLKSIEEEILKDLKIKQDLVDARHENMSATSDNELTFKWLQRFGFFGILSNLKTLLEQTGGKVTTQELPLIEKIISQGTIKEASLHDGKYWLNPNGKVVYIDESQEHWNWMNRQDDIDDPWDEGWVRAEVEGSASHIILQCADINSIPDIVNNFLYQINGSQSTTIIIEDAFGKNWTKLMFEDAIENGIQKAVDRALQRKRMGSIKEASSFIQDINGVRVYRNPTPEQAVNLFRQSKYRALRYIATAYEDIYMWDASDIEHSQMAEDLGLTEDPDWYNGAGTLTTEDNTRQKAERFSRHSVASIKEAFLKEAFEEESKETDTDICVDLDRTIAKPAKHPDIGEPIEGAKESLVKLKELGYNIIIYSCRGDTEEGLKAMEEWLDKHDMPYDSIFSGEKPFFKYLIDDRAIKFDNWESVLKQVEKTEKKASLAIVAAPVNLPVIDPKTFKRKEPYALFIGTGDYGSAGKIDMFNVYGEHPMITKSNVLPTVTLDTLIQNNIPVIGKEPRAGEKQPFQDISGIVKQAFSKRDLVAKTKKVKQGEYGAIMALVPHDIAQEIVEFGVRNIKDNDVFSDKNNPRLGRELEPHVTVKYGLLEDSPKTVRRFFNDSKPFKAKLGKVRHFEPPEMEFDVVTIEVISEDLEHMNKKVTEHFKCAKGLVSDEYHPHITLSYVKRGKGKDYVGSDEFEGKEIILDTLIISPRKGNRTYFSIGSDKESSFILEQINKVSSGDNFLPSFFNDTNNEWQFEHGGDDQEIDLNPDSISDEETYYAPCTVGKPRSKEVWRQFLSMFQNPFSKKEEMKIEAGEAEEWDSHYGDIWHVGDKVKDKKTGKIGIIKSIVGDEVELEEVGHE